MSLNLGKKEAHFVYQGDDLIYPNYASKENLVLHYDFSGMKNTDVTKGVAEDLSGNGNNGTLQNFAYIDGSGYLDNALIFDGIDDFITIPEPQIDLDDFTYSEGINVLSFRGDNVATVVDGVVEIGGRNLVQIGSWITWAGGRANEGYSITLTGTSTGIFIRPSALTVPIEVNTRYTLSFKIRKVSGTLNRIGGHATPLFAQNPVIRFNGAESTGTWAFGLTEPILNDGNWHSLAYSFTTAGDIDSSDGLYIQPNRTASHQNKSVLKDIQLGKSDRASDWAPAPEDQVTTTLKPTFGNNLKSALYWNRALTDEELLQVYNTQIKRT